MRVSSDKSTHFWRFAVERTSERYAVATVLLSVHYYSHCKNKWGISSDARPNYPYAQPLTPIVYSCSIGPLLVRYFTPVTSIVNTCCHTALHQSTENVHDVSMCAYSLRAKMRLSGPVLAASLPSSREPALVPPLCPRVQNAFFANCWTVDESQEGFEFALLSFGRSVQWDSHYTVMIIGLLT